MWDRQPSKSIRLDLPSSMQHVYLLDTIILEILKEMEFDEETSEQVTLAVIEAGTNAIKHGNQEDFSKSAHFEFIVQSDKLYGYRPRRRKRVQPGGGSGPVRSSKSLKK